jgi:hypothetical protein
METNNHPNGTPIAPGDGKTPARDSATPVPATPTPIPDRFETVLEVVNDRPHWILHYGLIPIIAFIALFCIIFYPYYERSAEYTALATVRPSSTKPISYQGEFSIPLATARTLHTGGPLRVDTRDLTGEEQFSEGTIIGISPLIGPDTKVAVHFSFSVPSFQASPFYFEQATLRVFVRR